VTTTDLRVDEGYAPGTGGVQTYWRSLGDGGTPLVVVHGGSGVVERSATSSIGWPPGDVWWPSSCRATAVPPTSTGSSPGTPWPTTWPWSCATSTSVRPTSCGRTHYDVSSSPELAVVIDGFLG
jgi:hypothetical protein